ncbi:hypothetical protein JCM6882_001674 [Rhodosporidiobolus microsporus]
MSTPADVLPASAPSGSIRDASPPPSANPPVPSFEHEDGDSEDTFHQMLSVFVDEPIGSMSISPANRDVALGARKGLFIIDLQNPYDPPRFLPHSSAWEVADVQWNPFPQRSEWVASTSNQQSVIYNLSYSSAFSHSPIEHALYGHTRAVTDINWSPGAPEVLASCAMDGWVMAWDLRAGFGSAGRSRKPIWRVCGWGAPATQVKWNRREPHIIASSHDNVVHIWDDRMGAKPVETIQGHTAKIYGIDWSRKDAKRLVTCSLDMSFKSWSLDDLANPLRQVNTSAPIWRARWLPFGDGILTLPQRSDHGLSIWGTTRSDEQEQQGEQPKPVARFEGAREGVKEYVWRTRGGEDLESDDRQFQLVTWAKDRRLRLWPINENIMKDVGHIKGSPIEVPVTRRGGPDISYRSFHETPAPPLPLSFAPTPTLLPKHLAPATSLLSASLSSPSTPSLLTSSLRNIGTPSKENIPPLSLPPTSVAQPVRASAMMTTTKVRTRRQKEHDRLAWMEGVKIIKPPQAIEGGSPEDGEDEEGGDGLKPEPDEQPSATVTRASSLVRGTDGGTVTAREGDETERAESESRRSEATGTAVGKEVLYANLGEEITSVVRRFPRVTFEKVHVAGRTCTVSLYSPLFLRATFTFPRNYPPSAPPAIELERSVEISLKQRAAILQGVRRLMSLRVEKGLPSLEQALRYLLGDRSLDRAEEEDDDEAEEVLDETTANPAAEILRNNANVLVPPPRRGGATFGPSGQLVVFFPTNVFVSPTSEKDGRTSPPNDPATEKKRKFPLRLSEAFGNLPSESPEYDGEYQETDEALQVLTAHSYRPYCTFRPRGASNGNGLNPTTAPSFSTIVKIKDVSHLTLLHPSRTVSSLGKPPLEVAQEAVAAAIANKDVLLAKVWMTMLAFLQSGLGIVEGESTSRLESLLAERLLQELMKYLALLRDIQTLGVIACLLETYTRDVEEALSRRAAGRPPEIDYFSHRHRPSPPLHRSHNPSSDSGEQTPLPNSASSYQLRRTDSSLGGSHSPKASWANLSGFFNSSMLSLRSGSPSSPQSPEHPPHPPIARPSSFHSLGPRTASPLQSPGLTPGAGGLPKTSLRSQSSFPSALHHHRSDSLSSPEDARSGARTRTKTSPNVVTFGGTSVALIPSKTPPQVGGVVGASAEKEGGEGEKAGRARKRVAVSLGAASYKHSPITWWLTPRALLELELIRLAYAELLFRWGLDLERVHVLKLCRVAAPAAGAAAGGKGDKVARGLVRRANGLGEGTAIETPRSCVHCGTLIQLGETACSKCHRRQRAVMCVLCHLPVTGLTQSCTTCLHVGHLGCMRTWFDGSDSCPTGCGCSCLTNGGTSGLFHLPPTSSSAGGRTPLTISTNLHPSSSRGAGGSPSSMGGNLPLQSPAVVAATAALNLHGHGRKGSRGMTAWL